MIKKFFLILALCLFASANALQKNEILVSAAASLRDALTELGRDFEKAYDIKVHFNFAGSGQLKAQIEAGAPVDVFVSASDADVDYLDSRGMIIKNSKTIVAKNILILIEPFNKSNIKKIIDLKNKNIKKIAIGNSKTVPAGGYAKETLTFYRIYDATKYKLVNGENVKQVLDYVARDEVDAGFVYLTDARAEKQVRTALILKADTHKPICYPAAVISASSKIEEAIKFVDFLASDSAKRVFAKYGFMN